MENPTQKTFKEAEEVLSTAVQKKVTIADACIVLDKNPDFMFGIAGKIEKAYKSGTIKESLRDSLFGLYSKYTRIIASQNKKIKQAEAPSDKSPVRMLKGAKSKKVSKDKSKVKNINVPEKKSLSSIFDDVFVEDTTSLPMLSQQEQEMLEYNADTDEKYEERSIGEKIRSNDTFTNAHGDTIQRITGYKYKIFIRDERPLIGDFTREEMDKIYRLYSSMDGAGLTLRAVSREFHMLNYRDFKRILRAFNITKASVAVAPHILEEYSEDEICSLILRNKENNILKKLDLERNKYYEKKYFETRKELNEYKSSSDWIENLLNSWFDRKKPELSLPVDRMQKGKTSKLNNSLPFNEKPLFCIFGDIHYGKKYDSPVFGRGYNKEIAHERVMQIAKDTIEEAKRMKTQEIVMICLGDLIESAMEDGMHPGHSMEMDIFQDEQIFFAFNSMEKMLREILEKTDCKITFCSIHGNHDRLGIGRDDDKSRTAGKIITGFLKRMMEKESRIEMIIPKNNLLKLNRGKICIIAQHGDSQMNKKKPSELVNLFGEGTSRYHLLLKGHWHSLKADEGTNYITITAPAVASADKYILEALGNNSLPGFILGSEPDCYGFDYKKITLY